MTPRHECSECGRAFLTIEALYGHLGAHRAPTLADTTLDDWATEADR